MNKLGTVVTAAKELCKNNDSTILTGIAVIGVVAPFLFFRENYKCYNEKIDKSGGSLVGLKHFIETWVRIPSGILIFYFFSRVKLII